MLTSDKINTDVYTALPIAFCIDVSQCERTAANLIIHRGKFSSKKFLWREIAKTGDAV